MIKKTIYASVLALIIAACGNNANNNESSGANTGSGTETSGTTADAGNADAGANAGGTTHGNGISDEDYQKGLALVAKSDCLTCHKIDEKLVGPAYKDIANKYTADDKIISQLANKVIKGGSGNWGQVPMSPHPGLSEDDAKQMVKYVLSLK